MKHIEELLAHGYDLTVKKTSWRDEKRPFHASISLGTTTTSHNFLGNSVDHAISGLEDHIGVVLAEPQPGSQS